MDASDKLLFRYWYLSLFFPVELSFSEIPKDILGLVMTLIVCNVNLFVHLLERYIVLLVIDAAYIDSVATITSLFSGVCLQDGILLLLCKSGAELVQDLNEILVVNLTLVFWLGMRLKFFNKE